ncbi:MAG: hypothetical protein HUK05_06190 [Prevotella sp.]|nr:hypothetical protein [Prevotella sp.]
MKIVKLLLLILGLTSLASCEPKKTRAEIEADFKDYDSKGAYDEFTTSEKITANSSDDPKAFSNSLTDLEKQEAERKKKEEAEKKSDVEKAAEAYLSEGYTPHTISSEYNEQTEQNNNDTQSDNPTEIRKSTEQTNTTEPSNVVEPVRQQTIIQKTESSKKEVIIDGQAQ